MGYNTKFNTKLMPKQPFPMKILDQQAPLQMGDRK